MAVEVEHARPSFPRDMAVGFRKLIELDTDFPPLVTNFPGRIEQSNTIFFCGRPATGQDIKRKQTQYLLHLRAHVEEPKFRTGPCSMRLQDTPGRRRNIIDIAHSRAS